MVLASLAALLAGFYLGADAAGCAWLTGAEPRRCALVVAGWLGLACFALLLTACAGLWLGLRTEGRERATPAEGDQAGAASRARRARQVRRRLLVRFCVKGFWLAWWACLGCAGAARVWFAWPPPPPVVPESWLGRAHAVEVQGEITSTALGGEGEGRRGARVALGRVRIEGVVFPSGVMLSLPPELAAPSPGTCLEGTARLQQVRGLANPGLPDPTLAARAAGLALVGRAKTVRFVPCRERPGWSTRLRRAAFRLHATLASHVRAALPERQAAFVLAAALGERQAVPADVEEGFRVAGATHVLSVSGLHLAVVLALAFTGLRRCLAWVPRLPLLVAPSSLAALGSLLFVVAFTLVSGEALATVRASLMAASMLLAFVVNRRANLTRALLICTLVVFAVAPLALLDVSLQLSLLSVVALALAAGAKGSRLPSQEKEGSRLATLLRALGTRVVTLAGVSFAAAAGTTALVVHVFGEWAPAGVIGNLVLVPIVELAVVPLALAGAVASCVWRAAGGLLLQLAGWGSKLGMALGGLFGETHALVRLPSPSGWATTLFTVAALGALALFAEHRRARAGLGAAAFEGRWSMPLAASSLVVLFSLGVVATLRGFAAHRPGGNVRVTFLDVGQGDAAVVEGPGDRVLVVDGGGNEDGSFDPGEQVIAPFLRRHGVSRVELVILSHPHPDHMNGLFAVLERFRVEALWTSGDDGKNPRYGKLLALAKARGTSTPVPRDTTVGGLHLEPLGPFVGDEIGPPEGVSVNDASLVVRLGFGGRHVLFAGDVESQGEAELVGRAALGPRWPLAADVLKVPHHASRTSSSAALLEAVRPCFAVASLAFDNRFGFPHREVVTRYREKQLPLLRTDRDGAVSLTLTSEGRISFSCVREKDACSIVSPLEAGGDQLPCRTEPSR